MQIFSNDPKGLNAAIVETGAGQTFPVTGPVKFDIQDPGNTITFTPGSADNSTPANFKPNGSGATGTVTVTATDTGNVDKLADTQSFDVVAPVVAKPDKLALSFVPAP